MLVNREKNPYLFYLFNSRLFVPKILFHQVIKDLGKHLNGSLLDVGAGLGPYRKYTSCEKYTSLESNPDLNPTVVGTADEMPFNEKVFDSVLCTEVIEHMPEPEEVIQEIYRVLKPGGKLLLSTPMSWCLHYEPNDYYRFTKYGLKYLLEKNGFKLIKVKRVGGVLSLAGSRIIDVSWKVLSNLLWFIPYKLKKTIIVLFFSLPFSLLVYLFSILFDRVDDTDALNWIILTEKL